MKSFVYVLKAVSSIASAVLIYFSVMKITANDPNMLLYIIASVFALAFTSSLFCVSSLVRRVEGLETFVRKLSDDGYEDEGEGERRECPYCHAFIDANEEICPYCNNEDYSAKGDSYDFATEDPDYRGTDFSGEELVSAHISDDTEN